MTKFPDNLKLEVKKLLDKFNIALPTPTPAPAPVQLTEAQLQDGTTVKYDSLTAGATLTIVTPEGEIAATPGDYTLSDGTVIKVVEAEKIESVTAPTAQQAAPALPNVLMKKHDDLKAEFEAFKAVTAKDREADKAAIATANETINVFKKDIAEFIRIMNEVMDTPSAEPKEKPKNKQEKKIDKFINRN